MSKSKEKPYRPGLERLMAEKTKLLSQAQSFTQMGLVETAHPLWRSAASLEERIAPRLDAIGRNREAALHRISAATCHRNAGQFSQAANLFQGALAGPLNDATRGDVEQFLEECLAELEAASPERSVVAV
jgi:hypothetical protein